MPRPPPRPKAKGGGQADRQPATPSKTRNGAPYAPPPAGPNPTESTPSYAAAARGLPKETKPDVDHVWGSGFSTSSVRRFYVVTSLMF